MVSPLLPTTIERAARHSGPHEPVFHSNDPHVWRMLAVACGRGTVEFRYRRGSTPGALCRVTPEAVISVIGCPEIYVLAECHLRTEQRVFRLDRVEWLSD